MMVPVLDVMVPAVVPFLIMTMVACVLPYAKEAVPHIACKSG